MLKTPKPLLTHSKKLSLIRLYGKNILRMGLVGTSQQFSWTSYTDKYIDVISELFTQKNNEVHGSNSRTAYGKKLTNAEMIVISDHGWNSD